ncbi:MAG: IS110 family transposase [Deltaproteobacteria bacterium]|nr:IS110 family transposase [Deltaproteobacteria bacterium]
MEVVFNRCCGLDVHKDTVAACIWVRDEAAKVHKEVRTFGTTTHDLLLLHDWLGAHKVTHVAMESTGVYWKPVYNLLEEDFTILLVNAAHIKAVPGRKTDVKDCEWIADLLAHGLLKGSFIPPEPIRDLRDLTRYRKSLMDERVREVNRLHKLLQSANIKLSSVATDVMGASGRAMLEALLEGKTDPEALAELARGRLRNKLPELLKALEGRFRPHHRFMLEQILLHLDFLDKQLQRVSQEVAMRMGPFKKQVGLLCTIPGVELRTAENIIAEIGVDMSRFPTHRHLASWAGLCPGNNESAGKRKSGRTRKGDCWFRRTMIEASWAASRTKNTYLSSQYHRLAPRRGKKKASVAVAHSITVIVYYVMKELRPFVDLGADYFDRLNVSHIKRYYVKRLERLGFKVTIDPFPEAA